MRWLNWPKPRDLICPYCEELIEPIRPIVPMLIDDKGTTALGAHLTCAIDDERYGK